MSVLSANLRLYIYMYFRIVPREANTVVKRLYTIDNEDAVIDDARHVVLILCRFITQGWMPIFYATTTTTISINGTLATTKTTNSTKCVRQQITLVNFGYRFFRSLSE
jgi:hypothetical protein